MAAGDSPPPTISLAPASNRAAALAIDIARSSSLAKKRDVALAPESKHEAVWVSPCAIDPFTISVEEQLGLLTSVDEELRRAAGVTLAQTSMIFHRTRQIFVSSIGSVIDQTRTTSGAGFEALSFQSDQIQKRSYPNSFGGQHQLKGYELVHRSTCSHMPRALRAKPWLCTRPTSARRAALI